MPTLLSSRPAPITAEMMDLSSDGLGCIVPAGTRFNFAEHKHVDYQGQCGFITGCTVTSISASGVRIVLIRLRRASARLCRTERSGLLVGGSARASGCVVVGSVRCVVMVLMPLCPFLLALLFM